MTPSQLANNKTKKKKNEQKKKKWEKEDGDKGDWGSIQG
jgi:hypothetical protein